MSTERGDGATGGKSAGEPGEDPSRLRRILAWTAAGCVANAAWLAISMRDGDLLAGLLSGIGLVFCAVPATLCARRLAGGPPRSG